jgi:hypothetical protein
MSEISTEPTELTSQYSAQVAGDLERNAKEQERLNGEIEALQGQLAALRRDHAVLTNIQQALGGTTAPAAVAVTTVPAARTKSAATSGTGKRADAKKRVAAGRKLTGGKNAEKASATPSARPTLVDCVRERLAGLSEPRSAAEITTALAQQYPERAIKATVVRTTLEGLVAKNRAQRIKQGRSVYYTASDAAKQSASGEQPA